MDGIEPVNGIEIEDLAPGSPDTPDVVVTCTVVLPGGIRVRGCQLLRGELAAAATLVAMADDEEE